MGKTFLVLNYLPPFLSSHFRLETLLNVILENAEGGLGEFCRIAVKALTRGPLAYLQLGWEAWRLHQELTEPSSLPTPHASEDQGSSKGWQTHCQEPDWQFLAIVVINCYTG